MNKVAVIGNLSMDILVNVDQFPEANKSVLAKSINYQAGGKGIYQAAAASALEASVILIGTVGEDAFGQQLIAEINKIPNLDSTRVINKPDASTGITSTLIKGTDELSAYIPGANKLTTAEVAKENEFLFKEADVLLTQLGLPEETIETALRGAEFGKTLTILNPSPYVKFPEKWLQAVSIITPNEKEFICMAEDSDIAPGSLEKRILDWQKKYPNTKIIVNRGKDGLSYIEGQNVVTIKAIEDKVGSVDIFNGALAALLSKDLPFEEAIYKAAVAAGIAKANSGLGAAPKMEDINLYLSKTSEDANESI